MAPSPMSLLILRASSSMRAMPAASFLLSFRILLVGSVFMGFLLSWCGEARARWSTCPERGAAARGRSWGGDAVLGARCELLSARCQGAGRRGGGLDR